MRGAAVNHASRRTAPRAQPSPGVFNNEAPVAAEERRPSREFTAITFARLDDAAHRQLSSSGPRQPSTSPPQLSEHLLADTSRQVLEQDLAAHHTFLATPPDDILAADAATSVPGPLVTEAWTRSVLKPGDESLLYETAVGASSTHSAGYVAPGRRRLGHHAHVTGGLAPRTRAGASSAPAGLWRLGVAPPSSTGASVYAQLGRLGRLRGAETGHVRCAVADGVGGGAMRASRSMPQLFSRPSYQRLSHQTVADGEVGAAPMGHESTSITSSSWEASGHAQGASAPSLHEVDSERGTQLLQHAREELLARLRGSQERQDAPMTTEAYPLTSVGHVGATPPTSLLRVEPAQWTAASAGDAAYRHRRPHLQTGGAPTEPRVDEAKPLDKAVARALAYAPLPTTEPRLASIAEEVLVRDAFFPLTSEENYERLLLANDEYTCRQAAREAWRAGQAPPVVSPFRARHARSEAFGASVSPSRSSVTPAALVAPFGYSRSRTAARDSEGYASVASNANDGQDSAEPRAAVPITLARKAHTRRTKGAIVPGTAPTRPPRTSAESGKRVKTSARSAAPASHATKSAAATTAPMRTPRASSTTTKAAVPREATAHPRREPRKGVVSPPPVTAVAVVPSTVVPSTAPGETYGSVSDEVAALLARSQSPPAMGTAHGQVTCGSAGSLPPALALETPPRRSPVPASRTPRRPSLDSSVTADALEVDAAAGPLCESPLDQLNSATSSGRRVSGGSAERTSSPTPTVPAASRILADAVMPASAAAGGGATSGNTTPGRRTQRLASSIGYLSPASSVGTPTPPANATTTTVGSVTATADAAASSTASLSSSMASGRASSVTRRPMRSTASRLTANALLAELTASGAGASCADGGRPLPVEAREAALEADRLEAATADTLSFSLGPWENPLEPAPGDADAAQPVVCTHADELRQFITYYRRKACEETASLLVTDTEGPDAAIPSREALLRRVRQDAQVSDAPPDEDDEGEAERADELDDGSDHERNVRYVLDVFGIAWLSPTLFASSPTAGRPGVVQAVESLFHDAGVREKVA